MFSIVVIFNVYLNKNNKINYFYFSSVDKKKRLRKIFELQQQKTFLNRQLNFRQLQIIFKNSTIKLM